MERKFRTALIKEDTNMKINDQLSAVKFEMIPVGSCFKWDNNYFIRVENDDDSNVNAVRLRAGTLYCIDNDELVTPVEATVTIDSPYHIDPLRCVIDKIIDRCIFDLSTSEVGDYERGVRTHAQTIIDYAKSLSREFDSKEAR